PSTSGAVITRPPGAVSSLFGRLDSEAYARAPQRLLDAVGERERLRDAHRPSPVVEKIVPLGFRPKAEVLEDRGDLRVRGAFAVQLEEEERLGHRFPASNPARPITRGIKVGRSSGRRTDFRVRRAVNLRFRGPENGRGRSPERPPRGEGGPFRGERGPVVRPRAMRHSYRPGARTPRGRVPDRLGPRTSKRDCAPPGQRGPRRRAPRPVPGPVRGACGVERPRGRWGAVPRPYRSPIRVARLERSRGVFPSVGSVPLGSPRRDRTPPRSRTATRAGERPGVRPMLGSNPGQGPHRGRPIPRRLRQTSPEIDGEDVKGTPPPPGTARRGRGRPVPRGPTQTRSGFPTRSGGRPGRRLGDATGIRAAGGIEAPDDSRPFRSGTPGPHDGSGPPPVDRCFPRSLRGTPGETRAPRAGTYRGSPTPLSAPHAVPDERRNVVRPVPRGSPLGWPVARVRSPRRKRGDCGRPRSVRVRRPEAGPPRWAGARHRESSGTRSRGSRRAAPCPR